MHPLQAMIDGMSAQMKKERAATQMTLGELIHDLEIMSPDFEVTRLVEPHSYRGYYSDLAFEPDSGTISAGDLLESCKSCMGKEFTGYKGGEYLMGESTPVWISHYGTTGKKLMALHPDGTIETADDI